MRDKIKENECCLYSRLWKIENDFNESDYDGEEILQKHVIDNSCEPGAFLKEIVHRYINSFFKAPENKDKMINWEFVFKIYSRNWNWWRCCWKMQAKIW